MKLFYNYSVKLMEYIHSIKYNVNTFIKWFYTQIVM